MTQDEMMKQLNKDNLTKWFIPAIWVTFATFALLPFFELKGETVIGFKMITHMFDDHMPWFLDLLFIAAPCCATYLAMNKPLGGNSYYAAAGAMLLPWIISLTDSGMFLTITTAAWGSYIYFICCLALCCAAFFINKEQ